MSIPKEFHLEGIETIFYNADSLLEIAVNTYFNEEYRISYFFSFTSCEEYGKILFLLKHWDIKSITRKEWFNKKSFRGHKSKVIKAEKVRLHYRILDFIKNDPRVPNLKGGTIIQFETDKDLDKYSRIRNDCLHTDFDFSNQKWKTPLDITDLDEKTSRLILYALDARKYILEHEEIQGILLDVLREK